MFALGPLAGRLSQHPASHIIISAVPTINRDCDGSSMKASRYTKSRQKACLRCSAAKAKCDRKSERCSRCSSKGLICVYSPGTAIYQSDATTYNKTVAVHNGPDNSFDAHQETYCSTPDSSSFLGANTQNGGSLPEHSRHRQLSSTETNLLPSLEGSPLPDFPGTREGIQSDADPTSRKEPVSHEVCCPIDAEAIRNRWLNVYLPVPGQMAKEYSASITAFIRRVLKAYTDLTIHGRGVPPFVHTSQTSPGVTSQPLATCLTIVRMCQDPLPGSESVAMGVLQREMININDQHQDFDDHGSLAVFQAYLIYCLVLFYKFRQSQDSSLREAMMNLQNLACATSRRGLMCVAEMEHARPRWEAWVLMEAKRRTLYTMYLFDSVLSAEDGLPTALGTELTGLPAPSNKQLWEAKTRIDWDAAYNVHLADLEQSLRIDELWPIPDGLDPAELAERRRRVDMWLQQVDQYGTMLYAVTSCTHGG